MRSLSRFSRALDEAYLLRRLRLGDALRRGRQRDTQRRNSGDRPNQHALLSRISIAGIKAWSAAAQQISVHDPALRRPLGGANAMDLVRHVAEAAGDQDLVRCAEIGAPVDVDVLGRRSGGRSPRRRA